MMRFRREKKRTVPGLNTTSTADISFMLLILFLVASSMDLDKGISRQLPPMDKTQKQATAVDGKKLMRIAIDDDSKVQLEGKAIAVETLHQRVQQFIEANRKAHMIQLQTSRKASYDVYVQVQNQLVEAYNTLRNARSEELFGKDFELCSHEQQAQIMDEIPLRISEVYAIPATGKAEKGGTE